MTIKTILIFLFVFPLGSLASDLHKCAYNSIKVLKINSSDGASCKQVKLCFAEVLCAETVNGKAIDVSRTIVCGLDTSGNCPDVEICRADKTSASFEKEAMVGTAGKEVWSAIVIAAAMPLMRLYYGYALEKRNQDSNLETISDDKAKVKINTVK